VVSGVLWEHGSGRVESGSCSFGSGAGAWRFDKGQGASRTGRECGLAGPERGGECGFRTLPLRARFGGLERGGGGTLRQPWFGSTTILLESKLIKNLSI
jgi:hypothetical protein